MIEKILERLEEEQTKWKDIYELDRDRSFENHYAMGRKRAFGDAIEIVQEVAKEYESRTCANCKYETIPGNFEPCRVCVNAYSDDCFEPKSAPYQKGE